MVWVLIFHASSRSNGIAVLLKPYAERDGVGAQRDAAGIPVSQSERAVAPRHRSQERSRRLWWVLVGTSTDRCRLPRQAGQNREMFGVLEA